jgi:hypothetical protein
MKQLIKHKFNNRLLKLLKYNKNKYIKKFGTNQKKIVFFSATSYNKKLRRRFLKKERLKHYNISNVLSKNTSVKIKKKDKRIDPKVAGDLLTQEKSPRVLSQSNIAENNFNYLQRKEYPLQSVLFKTLFKHSKKYSHYLAGKEFKRRAFFMPSKLNLTRFKINKILKSYYTNLSYKSLKNLSRKKSLSKIQRYNIPFNKPLFIKTSSKKRGNMKTSDNDVFEENFVFKKPVIIEKRETAKNFILNLEQRLDNSLLRILNFNNLFRMKRYNK